MLSCISLTGSERHFRNRKNKKMTENHSVNERNWFSEDLAYTLSVRSFSLSLGSLLSVPHLHLPSSSPLIHLLFILSCPLLHSTAAIKIGALMHNTVLTAHAAIIIHMLTHIFQGHLALTHSTTVHMVNILTPIKERYVFVKLPILVFFHFYRSAGQ